MTQWTKTPPTEPGWYWVRKGDCLFATSMNKPHGDYLVKIGCEFWPVKLEEPK